MRVSLKFVAAAGLAFAATAAFAQSSPLNAPRFFDPRVRCHDAPHLTGTSEEFLGRISVLPGGNCLVRQGTGRGAAIRLLAIELIEPPEYGRLSFPNRTSYSYRAPPGTVMDEFVVRLIYEGPDGGIAAPQIRYEVRVGR